ncbi:hypothetical protein F2P81_018101 [Scophthalmus maximus]|uniref:Uncharacterized protein n=1 Tax=Scophthalmus maximus TaxID=52904 RepID=A0A6A4S199_SCOMX|nr:hypothetical protein F2P81_018101 [Scophthalmus maximus]
MSTCVMIINHVFLIMCSSIFHLVVISFCRLSVLRVLIRPGPGERGGDRERVDRSKRRAFYTIIVMWALLVLRLSWNVTWAVLQVRHSRDCVSLMSELWFNLPGSLVLLVMFLQRSSKRVYCKNGIK